MIRRIRKTLAAMLLALAFIVNTGCAAFTPKLQTVLVPCKVSPITRPVFPFDNLGPGADNFLQTQTLLADRKVRQGYEGKLEAAVESCR